MPTVTVRTVGTASRQYSTTDAWVDACPANIVSSDEIWKGEHYADSEFVAPTNSLIASASGITTDDTHYLWMTTAAGQSFVDDGSAATLPLRYDTTKGVSMKADTTYSGVFHFGSVRVLVEKIMVYYDVGGSYSSSYMCQGGVYRQMVFESRKTSRWTSGGSKFYNCLLYDRGSGAAPVGIINDVFTACTVVRASDASSGGTAMNQDFGYYPDLKSTAVFGFATNFGGTVASYNNCNNVASNSASVPGTSTQASLTYTDQFENTTAAGRDWRVKAGSDLEANGSRHQGTEGSYSALGTNDLDILGRARSTSTPTIGCWEVISGGGSQSVTATGNIASAEAFGSTTVAPGAVSVTPSGIASAEAFGTAQLNQTITGAGNIASAEAFGSAAVVPGAVTITGAGAIASAEAFGDATVTAGGSFITGAGAIASAEAFGSTTVVPGAVTITGAGAIATAEAFGDAVVSAGGGVITGAGAIATAEAFGTHTVAPGAVSITGAGAIVSAEAFGTAAVHLYLLGAGAIASAETFGSAALQHGATTITGAGNIATGEAFGDALIPGGATYILAAGGIVSAEAFGPVPLIPQNYTPADRILEVEGGARILEVPGGDRVLIVPDGSRVLEVLP